MPNFERYLRINSAHSYSFRRMGMPFMCPLPPPQFCNYRNRMADSKTSLSLSSPTTGQRPAAALHHIAQFSPRFCLPFLARHDFFIEDVAFRYVLQRGSVAVAVVIAIAAALCPFQRSATCSSSSFSPSLPSLIPSAV